MPNKIAPPKPLFDTLENSDDFSRAELTGYRLEDYGRATAFLKSYNGSPATFNAYRREVERLLHWSWLFAKKSVKDLRRMDIEAHLAFCKRPPIEWIGITKAPRFVDKEGKRLPNSEWRPFIATLSKAEHRAGKKPRAKNYELSSTALKDIFAILSSFYNFLIQEDYTEVNPVAHIRQKSKFIRKQQGRPKIRRLSELQWQYVIEAAKHMAETSPEIHERTLFMISALYSMYLRISELAASPRWVPTMNHFERDADGNWWFTTVGKGNKQRQIAVSNAMLAALKRWRKHLGLSALPSPADNAPLFQKTKGKGPITNTSYIRKIVQQCFNNAIEKMKQDGFAEEAESLVEATVHWLRHTGISDDVKRRPREHVRDDAGHSSSAITDKYIDIELRERHASAKNKPLV